MKKVQRGHAGLLNPASAEGRDELNLAEFPLAALADRAPKGQKTLVFEDTVWDRRAQQRVTRRLTISASDRYGLPTALDDEVILGLVQLTRQANFADRHVTFSRYELINILAWRHEGKSYRRLDQSLRRWVGVTLYYDKAWWDKEAGCWIDAAFHLLDQITLARRRESERPIAGATDRTKQSTFTWNEIIFRSFQAGYLKRLDMEVYRSLQSTIAKRMLRFLDKRFYHRSRWEFPLVEFACEHIGLSRNYDTGQLKRRLAPAIAELEAKGVIRRDERSSRFLRLGRGDWRIVFRKGEYRCGTTPRNSPRDAATAELTRRGISARMARRLAGEFSPTAIAAQTEMFDRLVARGDARVSRNPAGFLVDAIRKNYVHTPPAPTQSVRDTPPSRRRRRVATKLKAAVGANEATDERIEEFLAALSAEERTRIERQAEREASKLLRDGLSEAQASGSQPASEAYRSVILRQHVRRLLRPAQDITKA